MALKDCIKKLGVVSPADEARLQVFLADGMTDEQAVRRLLIEKSVNVVSIADQAREAGAKINAPKDAIAEIRDLQNERVGKLMDDRAKLDMTVEMLNFAYGEMADGANMFQRMLDGKNPMGQLLENMDRDELLMRVGQIMFDPEVREQIKQGYVDIKSVYVRVTDEGEQRSESTTRIKIPKGETPQQVVDSLEEMQARRVANRKMLRETVNDRAEIQGQLDAIIARAVQVEDPRLEGLTRDVVDNRLEQIENLQDVFERADVNWSDRETLRAGIQEMIDDGRLPTTALFQFVDEISDEVDYKTLQENVPLVDTGVEQSIDVQVDSAFSLLTLEPLYEQFLQGDQDTFFQDTVPDVQVIEGPTVELDGKTFDARGRPSFDAGEDVILLVDAAKFRTLWNKSNVPDATPVLQEKIDNFRDFYEKNDVIQPGEAWFSTQGFQFTDGRHRTEFMLRANLPQIPIVMAKSRVKDFTFALEQSIRTDRSGRPMGEGVATRRPPDTQEFRDFISGTHVVDENGDPMIVYHGTQSRVPFDTFVPQGSFGGFNNMGTWFSSEPEHARRMMMHIDDTSGQMFPAYISMKNPWNTTWDELQAEIDRAIANHNEKTGDELVKYAGNQKETSKVGLVLREHFESLGYDGIMLENWTGDGEPAQNVYVAFKSRQIKAAYGATTFDPEDPSILRQGRRGSITFDRARKATINLYDAADLSTFIHEAGHLYLELFDHLYNRTDASEQIIRDGKTVLNYLGVDSFDQIKREHHEKWAESFEKYAMEGKAPSPALQRAFNSFRTWLTEVYRNIRGVRDIELPDDIRGVMDRILATDEEIALAEAAQDYAPLFNTAEEMGVSQEVFDVYKNSIIEAHEDAVAKESSKLLASMKRDELDWWKEEERREEAQVRLQAYQERVFNARARLANNTTAAGLPSNRVPLKIDRDSLLEVLQGDEEMMKLLPHTGAYGFYRRKGGTHVEIVATELGYRDALEMINDLIQAPKMETWIKAMTKENMRQKFPDPFKDASMAGAAVKAVHSTKRAGIIAAEMRQLRKKMREDRPIVRATEQRIARERREAKEANKGTMPKRAEIQMIRRAAAERIAASVIRTVKPHVYLNAERKSARLAFEAMERGDFEAAYNHKRQQLVNFEMYRAAVKASEQVNKSQRYLAKFNNKRVQQRMGKGGVLNQILGILEGTDLKRRSLADVDFREAMKDLRTAIDEGRLVVKPETLALIRSDLTNWQNLTVEQFQAMKEIVQQLEHEADRTEWAYLNDEKVKLDDIVTELEESIYDANEGIDLYGGKPSKGERAKQLKDQAIKAWLRPSTLARILDKAGWGSFTKRFIVPIRRAYAEKYIPQIHSMQERLAKIYMENLGVARLQVLNRRTIEVEGHSRKYSIADAISLALNMGNEGNERAVRGSLANGEQIYDETFINTMLGQLTEKDWRFVQEIWDYFEEFWPDIKAAEERRRGVAPERVEAKPLTVQTADGKTITLRGGYFPLHYDHTLSDKVKQQDFEEISAKMGLGVYVSASTRAGATYERVKQDGLPVRLDLNVVDIHLRDVIRDLALGDEVNAIQRVINDKRFRAAMRKTDNLEALKVLNLWLTDAAVGESPANHFVVKATRYIRGGFVKARLGLSGTVTLLQFTGFFQSMATIGSATLGKGLVKLMSNPVKWWKYVSEESAFIRARYEIGAWNRDVQDVQAHIDSYFGTVPTIGKRAFAFVGAILFSTIKYAQKVVDVTTWLASYEKARNGFVEGKTVTAEMGHDQAVLYADAQVENAQTSGFFSDRSPLERGTLSENIRQAEYVRIWTVLIGYMLAKGNIFYEKTKNADYKKPSTYVSLLADFVLLFALEGMASALIYGNWPEEDEEDGEKQYGKWVAKATLDSLVSGIPFIREIPQQRYGSGSTPIGALAKDSLDVYQQWVKDKDDDELNQALVKAIIDVLGTTTHVVPSSQLNRTLDAVWDEDETTPMEYITGPRDEE